MSKIEQLIAELCPNGVMFDKVGSLCKTQSPKVKIKSNAYLYEGTYPIIDQGQEYIGGYTNETRVFPQDEYIVFGDHTCVVKFIDFPFVQGADGVKILKAERNRVLSKYLYYVMANIRLNTTYARHWSKMKVQKIPVPPLEVQREIVRVLDSFTSLSAELSAELSARKKQYEYYRDSLLSFENTKVEYKKLGEIGGFYGGLAGKTKEDFRDGNAQFITYMNVFKNIDLDVTTDDKVKIKNNEKQNQIKYGDVLFTGSSESKEEVGFTSVLTTKTNEPLYLNSFCFGYRFYKPVVLPNFCKHLFRSDELRKQIKKTASGVTRFNVSKKKMEDVIIPVPPLEVQHEIVRVLDNFNAICSDLSAGLPAEIEARKKQYEYYRDKLLTFKELRIV